MPDCDEKVLASLDSHLANLPPISSLIREGLSPIELAQQVLNDSHFKLQDTVDLEFKCNCSRRHVLAMLAGFPGEELEALSQREEDTEITCEYCKTNYRFTPSELSHIAQGKNAAQ